MIDDFDKATQKQLTLDQGVELQTRFARAVANAWMGEKGAWKSRMKQPLSIRPNCKTYIVEEGRE